MHYKNTFSFNSYVLRTNNYASVVKVTKMKGRRKITERDILIHLRHKKEIKNFNVELRKEMEKL